MRRTLATLLAAVITLLIASGTFAQDAKPDSKFFIFLCFGQSNMEAGARPEEQDRGPVDAGFQMLAAVDMPRLNRVKGHWYVATPPLNRSENNLGPVDFFGRTMVANLPDDYRIGVINVSVAGAKIELWEKNSYKDYLEGAQSWMKDICRQYDDNPYQRLVDMAKIAQRDGVIKGILIHQGESNPNDDQWCNKVKGIYNSLMRDLGLDPEDVPLLAGELKSADEGGKCAAFNSEVLVHLPKVLPNSYIISSQGCKGVNDGFHFSIEGFRELGQRYAIQMLKCHGFEISDVQMTEPAVGAPSVDPGAAQTESTVVRLVVNTDEALHEIDPNVYGHFLEHIYHSANGGLWGELVWNRSFELSNGGEGVWSIEDGEVVQSALIPDVHFAFGDASWKDYEITLDACKERGAEGFMVMFRAQDERNFYWVNLGGWSNTRHAIEKAVDNRRVAISPDRDGRIESNRWYTIRVRVEGNHIQCWLDGENVIDMHDDEPFFSGMVGLATYGTHARYRNIKVTSLDGSTELFSGTPEIPKTVERVDFWTHFGDSRIKRVRDALNNEFSVELQSDGGDTGLLQENYRFKPQRFEGSLAMKGNLPEGVKVELLDRDTVLGAAVLGPPTGGWAQYPFQIQSSGSTAAGSVRISLLGKGSVKLDQFMLMGQDSLAREGFRPDLLEAVRGLRPPIIRWPGGCFASIYLWKDAIGPQHERRIYTGYMWEDQDINSLGTDEYMTLCEETGAKPLLVINTGLLRSACGAPAQFRLASDDDYLPYALDWLEYCNGDATTPMGKLRAANGHPEPYNVEYWELDNETWAAGVDAYIEKVKQFAPALRKKAEELGTPIRILACGGNRFDMQWNRSLIDACAPLMDYISIHNYEEPDNFASGVSRYEGLLVELADTIGKSANPAMEIYNSEWNAQSTDWRTGLYAGGLLNAYERQGKKFTLGGPALFLRHTSAGAWDNAFINFDQSGWYPAPNYVVMKLWWDNYASRFLPVSGDQRGCNIVATRSADGDFVVLKAVNPQDHAVAVEMNLEGKFVPKTASLQFVAPASLQARNSMKDPHHVKAKVGVVKLVGNRLSFEMPAYSVAVVRSN